MHQVAGVLDRREKGTVKDRKEETLIKQIPVRVSNLCFYSILFYFSFCPKNLTCFNHFSLCFSLEFRIIPR